MIISENDNQTKVMSIPNEIGQNKDVYKGEEDKKLNNKSDSKQQHNNKIKRSHEFIKVSNELITSTRSLIKAFIYGIGFYYIVSIIGTSIIVTLSFRFILDQYTKEVLQGYSPSYLTAYALDLFNTWDVDSLSFKTCSTEERFWALLLKPLNEAVLKDDAPGPVGVKRDIELGLQRITRELIARNISTSEGTFHAKVYEVLSDLNSTLCQRSTSLNKDEDRPSKLILEVFRYSCKESCEFCQAARLDKMIKCLERENERRCLSKSRRSLSEHEHIRMNRLKATYEDDIALSQDDIGITNYNNYDTDITPIDTHLRNSWDYYGNKFFKDCPSVFHENNEDTIHPIWRTLGLPPGDYLAVLILAVDTMEKEYLSHDTQSEERSAHILLRMLSHESIPVGQRTASFTNKWMDNTPLKIPDEFESYFYGICEHWTRVLDFIMSESLVNPALREAVKTVLIAHGHSKWLLQGPTDYTTTTTTSTTTTTTTTSTTTTTTTTDYPWFIFVGSTEPPTTTTTTTSTTATTTTTPSPMPTTTTKTEPPERIYTTNHNISLWLHHIDLSKTFNFHWVPVSEVAPSGGQWEATIGYGDSRNNKNEKVILEFSPKGIV